MKKTVFLSICLLIFSLQTNQAQDKISKKPIQLHPAIEAGFGVGGQVNNENFIMESSLDIQISVDKKISKRIYYGLGWGLNRMDGKTYMPLFVEFKGLLDNKRNIPYLFAQMGYSMAWSEEVEKFEHYNYQGGFYFSPGIGRRIAVKDHYYLLFSLSYRHQFGGITYETPGTDEYREEVNFDMISFRVGFMF